MRYKFENGTLIQPIQPQPLLLVAQDTTTSDEIPVTSDGDSVPVTVVKSPYEFVAQYGGAAAIQFLVWLTLIAIASKMFGLGNIKDAIVNWFKASTSTQQAQKKFFEDLQHDIDTLTEHLASASNQIANISNMTNNNSDKLGEVLEQIKLLQTGQEDIKRKQDELRQAMFYGQGNTNYQQPPGLRSGSN